MFLVRVNSYNPIAVRLQHVRALSLQFVINSQIQFLKRPFHRSCSRCQLQLVAVTRSCCSDFESIFDIFQIQCGID